MEKEKCLWCESEKLEDALVSGLVYLQLKKAKFFAVADSMVQMSAKVCVDCGRVDLFADVDKLKKLSRKK